MATVIPVLSFITGVAGFAQSVSSSSTSQSLAEEQWDYQKAAQKAQYESDIATYQYNIGQMESSIEGKKEEMEYELGTFKQESEKSLRGIREAIGASGATIGAGTPLDYMERTAREQEEKYSVLETSYLKDISDLEAEKEFYGEQIEETESLLDELFTPVEPKKKKQPMKYESHW